MIWVTMVTIFTKILDSSTIDRKTSNVLVVKGVFAPSFYNMFLCVQPNWFEPTRQLVLSQYTDTNTLAFCHYSS